MGAARRPPRPSPHDNAIRTQNYQRRRSLRSITQIGPYRTFPQQRHRLVSADAAGNFLCGAAAVSRANRKLITGRDHLDRLSLHLADADIAVSK